LEWHLRDALTPLLSTLIRCIRDLRGGSVLPLSFRGGTTKSVCR
jgi:hypothetical protein